MRERIRPAVLAVKHERKIVTRRVERGTKFDRAGEEGFGIGVAPEPRGKFGKHSHRGNVGWMRIQMRAQQRFGDGEAARCERGGGLAQPGIAYRYPDTSKIGAVRLARITRKVAVIAECAPQRGIIGRTVQRAGQERACVLLAGHDCEDFGRLPRRHDRGDAKQALAMRERGRKRSGRRV